jgi:hypothetical protein
MKKILVKYFIIFLIIGLIGFLFTNCGSSLNYIVSLSNAPIYLNFKVIYPSQVAFNIGTVLPLKIEYESKSYNIYPLILEISLYSTYQYIIDPYTSFILKIDNQIFFPKLPEEIINSELLSLLLNKEKNLLIVQPFSKTIRLIYFLPYNVENKKLKIICNINGKVFVYDL